MIEPTLKEEFQKQLDNYQALKTLERKIVQLLAVSYTALTETDILECLTQLGIGDENHKTLNITAVRKKITQLKKKQLLKSYPYMSGAVNCNEFLSPFVLRDVAKQGELTETYQTIQAVNPSKHKKSWQPHESYRTEDHLCRDIRFALHMHDYPAVKTYVKAYEEEYRDVLHLENLFFTTFYTLFDAEWLAQFPFEILADVFPIIFERIFLALVPDTRPYELLKELVQKPTCPDSLKGILAQEALMRGEVAFANTLIQPLSDSIGKLQLQGWLNFLHNQPEAAITAYETAYTIIKKQTKRRKIFLEPLAGIFFIFALLQTNDNEKLRDALKYTKNAESETIYGIIYVLMGVYLENQLYNKTLERNEILNARFSLEIRGVLGSYILALVHYWMDKSVAEKSLKSLSALYEHLQELGYYWVAAEVAQLAAKIKPDQTALQAAAETFFTTQGIHSIVNLIKRPEPWEVILNVLSDLNPKTNAKGAPSHEYRLAWWFKYDPDNQNHEVMPREQKLTAKGKWSKGRNIALKRLIENELEYAAPQDKEIARVACYSRYHYGNYGSYDIDALQALTAMVGHPLVFLADAPDVKIEIVKGEPELTITQNPQGEIQLNLSPTPTSDYDEERIFIQEETPTRFKIIEFTAQHQSIAQALAYKALTVPAEAKSKVLKAVARVSKDVTVHSDIGGSGEGLESVSADSTLHVHLLPYSDGLVAHLRVQPFKTGHYYAPGSGGKTLITELEGKRVQATRDLAHETAQVDALLQACPTLAAQQTPEGEYVLEEPEACLELLTELDAQKETLVVAWPEGEKFRIRQQADSNQLYMAIKRNNDWFSASGELKIDKDLVLNMQELMGLLENNSMGRFVQLSGGEFLALTKTFRKRLDELRAFTENQGKKDLRFHPLAALALQDFTDDLKHLKTDQHWQQHIQRLREAEAFTPECPSTLQAELRDYQLEGFRWLARLAHWGVGACLADDMGLGKTLQALALLLTRAPQGPALVIAPTSVCANWLSEAQKFAPTINPLVFGSSDRQQMLSDLQPYDLVICSYGLLQQETERLEKIQWHTVVLDEAQAIKNAATKRSQAAMSLQSDFKMMTTGTPIENHLGELWNLFRFINPGLLGSLDKFNHNFAYPIERNHDKTARQQLKKLIQPFMLRRTKTQVLEELPSRTEIMLQVELSKQELAFYEALRQQALQRLENTQDVSSGQRQLQILAEIMRLRRACCNPTLVEPDADISSSKLTVFGEVLEELLENRHKCLVFSQFVDHLTIIRQFLDDKGIVYQYLDGKTPAKARKARVDAFQAGQGDVFLISLKAGGVGLNLTAADYVIHMDPWWNPAVEDQASDRAHRIGQQRPVTIYRLVANDTIEEKIVALHHQKRDLADSLLEGSDVSGKVSADDLLQLIQMG